MESFISSLKASYSEEPITSILDAQHQILDVVSSILHSLDTIPKAKDVSPDKHERAQLQKWYEDAHIVIGAALSELIASQVQSLENAEKAKDAERKVKLVEDDLKMKVKEMSVALTTAAEITRGA